MSSFKYINGQLRLGYEAEIKTTYENDLESLPKKLPEVRQKIRLTFQCKLN